MTIPKKGDRVRYANKYAVHSGKLSVSAYCVKPYEMLDHPNFRNRLFAHCVVHFRANGFRVSQGLQFVQFFYPFSSLFPMKIVWSHLDETMREVLKNDGFLFLEAELEISDVGALRVLNVNYINQENAFSVHSFQQKRAIRPRSTSWRHSSDGNSWTCSVCDGDESTGCQMSDPQYCPNGRGID